MAFANVRKYATERDKNTFSRVRLLELTRILKVVVPDRIDLPDSYDPASFQGPWGSAPSQTVSHSRSKIE